MSYTQTTGARVAFSVVILSSVAMFGAAFDPSDASATMIYRLSLAATILACTGWVLALVSLSERELKRARQQGYDDALADQCDVRRQSLRVVGSPDIVRPVPVALDSLALESAAGEFGEECDLGDGTERTG